MPFLLLFQELYQTLKVPYTPRTGSDCEVIIPLFMQRGITGCLSALRGMFSFLVSERLNMGSRVGWGGACCLRAYYKLKIVW